jgi:hypothetical protein
VAAVQDVYDYLLAQTIAGGNTGWTLLRRVVTDAVGAADKLVVVSEDGGPPPEIHAGAGLGSAAVGDAGVMLTVRAGAKAGGDASFAKAEEIRANLHGRRNVTVGSITYARVTAMTPEPVWAGFDEQGRPLHTVALRLLAFTT